jgi:PAS domain-containing protein
MSQQEIEIILARHLIEYLALPMFIVDPGGDMLFYNEPAEGILGMRYSETGILPAATWSTAFEPVDQNGHPLKPDDLPLVIATLERRPAHSKFWIRSMDGVLRQIEVTAIPLTGQAGRFLGAVSIFWEVEQ